jgi:hypothetical protein
MPIPFIYRSDNGMLYQVSLPAAKYAMERIVMHREKNRESNSVAGVELTISEGRNGVQLRRWLKALFVHTITKTYRSHKNNLSSAHHLPRAANNRMLLD